MGKLTCYISGLYAYGTNNAGSFKKDFSVTALCKAVGISRTQFYKLVNNESVPTLDTAYKITDYLHRNTKYNYELTDLWSYEDFELLK